MKKFDLFKRMELQGYKGTDVDLEISLFEYNFIAKEQEDTGQKELHVILARYDKTFESSYISFKDIDEVIDESWFDKKEFFDCCDINETNWIESTYYIGKLSDLLRYYGSENILGTCYYPLSFLAIARWFKN